MPEPRIDLDRPSLYSCPPFCISQSRDTNNWLKLADRPRWSSATVSVDSIRMLHNEGDLEFVRHASNELAGSFTDARDHNLHAALNGLIQAIEADRARLRILEDALKVKESEAHESRAEV